MENTELVPGAADDAVVIKKNKSEEDSNRKTLLLNPEELKFFNTYVGTTGINRNKGTRKIKETGNEIIKALSCMLKFTQKELAGKLSADECRLLANAIDGNYYSCEVSAKYYLSTLVEDYCLYNDVSEQGEVVAMLKTKIDSLTEFQCYTVFTNAFQYLESDRNEQELKRAFLHS